MKKQTKILILIVMLLLTSTLTLTVNATDTIVTLNLDNNQVHVGNTFVVTMNVVCQEGINGLQGTVSYDQTKLELVSLAVADTTKWVNLGENLNLAVIHNSTETETSADIVKATFRVKDTAELGTTKISIADIIVDSDATLESMKQVGTKEIEVSIIEEPTNSNLGQNTQEKTLTGIEVSSDAIKIEYNVGDKFEKTGLIVKAKYSDGTSKEITDYTIINGNKLEKGQTSITISYTENEITKTTTQAIKIVDDTKIKDEIPNTGVSNIIGIMIVIAVFGVVSLVKYNKYREI